MLKIQLGKICQNFVNKLLCSHTTLKTWQYMNNKPKNSRVTYIDSKIREE